MLTAGVQVADLIRMVAIRCFALWAEVKSSQNRGNFQEMAVGRSFRPSTGPTPPSASNEASC